MSGCAVMSKSQLQLQLGLLSSMEEPKQGIVSVLAPEAARPPPSLRRTLSADMMSKTWLSHNGFVSQMKKIASSEHLSRSISEYSSSSTEEDEQEEEEEYEQVIKHEDKAGELDMFSLIMSQSQNKEQEQEQGKSAAPYVHPLVKKTAGALSKNSLEVCTESLGSETGSDGFSSNPSSEMGDTEDEQLEQHQQQILDYEDVTVVKYNFAAVGKKLPPPSFPPPLASLSSRGDGSSLRMSPRRENGRLVLEAVSVSAQNNFKAERHDGRLVLTLLNASSSPTQQESEEETAQGVEELEEYFGQDQTDYYHDEEEDEETEETEEEQEVTRGREIEIVMEQAPKMSSGGVIKLHRLALMMNKSASLATMNNQVVKFKEQEEDEEAQLAQSLPPVGRPVAYPPAGAAASLNAYEYCWRDKPTAAQAMGKNSDNKYIISKNNSSIIANNKDQQDQWVVIKSVQNMNGCKEHRRSLFREPYCIATS